MRLSTTAATLEMVSKAGHQLCISCMMLLTTILAGNDSLIDEFEHRGGLDTLKELMARAHEFGSTKDSAAESKMKQKFSTRKHQAETATASDSPQEEEALRWACLELMTCLYSQEEFEAVSRRESPRKKRRNGPGNSSEEPRSPLKGRKLEPAPLPRTEVQPVRQRRRAMPHEDCSAPSHEPLHLEQIRSEVGTKVEQKGLEGRESTRRSTSKTSIIDAKPKQGLSAPASSSSAAHVPRKSLRMAASTSALRPSEGAGQTLTRTDKRKTYANLGVGGRGRLGQNSESPPNSTGSTPTASLRTDSLVKRQLSTSNSPGKGSQASSDTFGAEVQLSKPWSTISTREKARSQKRPPESLRVSTADSAPNYGPPMSPAVKRAQAARSASPEKGRLDALLERRFDSVNDGRATHPQGRRVIAVRATGR